MLLNGYLHFNHFELPQQSDFREMVNVLIVTKKFTFISEKDILSFIFLLMRFIKDLTGCINSFDSPCIMSNTLRYFSNLSNNELLFYVSTLNQYA